MIRRFSLLAAVALPVSALAQSPPSQSEVNGFLLGQHLNAIRQQFGEPSQEQRTDDQWVYRVYIFDRAHHAYMVFKFAPDRPENAVSVQLDGGPGTTMYPFLGLVLGDDTTRVRSVLGAPSRVEREQDPPLTLWSYGGRNYSLEFTPAGRLASIQVFGYEGFPSAPSEGLARLEPLRDALASRNVDGLLAQVAPDIELYRNAHTFTFTGSARRTLQDSTADLSRALYGPGTSLRALLADSSLVRQATVAIRVYEHSRPGAIYTSYRFEEPAPLQELVFEGFAGQWRVWEVRFR